MSETHQGGCFCGAVRIEVTGEPIQQGFCHCGDCRSWSGSPVSCYGLWPAEQVRVVEGEDGLGSYSRTGQAVRRHCTTCGGTVMTEIPAAGLIDVYPVLLDGFTFVPAAHVHYRERVIDMPDGLPKFRDMPAEAGGSGEMISD